MKVETQILGETVNRIHATIAWGAIFLWWGITELFHFPNGMDALGIGLILAGLIAVRSLKQLPTNSFTITLCILSLAWGVLDLMRSVLHLQLGLSVEFALLLMIVGATLLLLVPLRARKIGWGELG